MHEKELAIWKLVDSEYLWKDRCYFKFLGLSLLCWNDDELRDLFHDKYVDASYNIVSGYELYMT